MTLTPYQIVVPLISIVAVAYAWNLFFRRKKTLTEACFWMLFWAAVALLALKPNLVSYLSLVTGIGNHQDAAIVTFVGILFFMVFYLVIRLEELEQRHARIVRMLAMRDVGMTLPEEEKKKAS